MLGLNMFILDSGVRRPDKILRSHASTFLLGSTTNTRLLIARTYDQHDDGLGAGIIALIVILTAVPLVILVGWFCCMANVHEPVTRPGVRISSRNSQRQAAHPRNNNINNLNPNIQIVFPEGIYLPRGRQTSDNPGSGTLAHGWYPWYPGYPYVSNMQNFWPQAPS